MNAINNSLDRGLYEEERIVIRNQMGKGPYEFYSLSPEEGRVLGGSCNMNPGGGGHRNICGYDEITDGHTLTIVLGHGFDPEHRMASQEEQAQGHFYNLVTRANIDRIVENVSHAHLLQDGAGSVRGSMHPVLIASCSISADIAYEISLRTGRPVIFGNDEFGSCSLNDSGDLIFFTLGNLGFSIVDAKNGNNIPPYARIIRLPISEEMSLRLQQNAETTAEERHQRFTEPSNQAEAKTGQEAGAANQNPGTSTRRARRWGF